MDRSRIGLLDTFGLRPFDRAWADAKKAVVGNAHVPPSQWGPSSVRIFKPHIALPAWLGIRPADRRVPIYNFFNRNPQPPDQGYSVKVTFCRDWLGGQHTYDGHLGTDFAAPVGTPICAVAPGRVVRVRNELDRGGLKVCIDHGENLFSTSNHLSRALVRVGDVVERGQPIGRCGASGLEFVLFFPWVAPHLHLNLWLNGEPIDPFALDGEPSLWRRRNDPAPFDGRRPAEDARVGPSAWDEAGVEAAIDACRDPDVRAFARSLPTLEQRAAEVLVARVYRPMMFDAFPPLYRDRHAPRPRLDLPFSADDYVGVRYPGHPR